MGSPRVNLDSVCIKARDEVALLERWESSSPQDRFKIWESLSRADRRVILDAGCTALDLAPGVHVGDTIRIGTASAYWSGSAWIMKP